MAAILHHGFVPGAADRIVDLHVRYYAAHAGFGRPFEDKVRSDLKEFCEQYDASRDGLWLALAGEEVEGSIAIDGRHAATEGAHLRWFITSREFAGMGVGNALLASAVDFCRAHHYPRIFLWTFDTLLPARHLYEKFGFRLAHEARGSQWGTEVNEQRFELTC